VSRRLVFFDAPSHEIAGHSREDIAAKGVFLLPRTTVEDIAANAGFELMAVRNFPGTPSQHYQYLFAKR
jgi:hypothetical protein